MEIIRKSKFKIKKLPRKIVIDKKGKRLFKTLWHGELQNTD